MPDFRRMDDPSRQAQLAEDYAFWEGMPGHATYRIICGACGKTFYAKMPTARWCSDRCTRDGARLRRQARSKARRERQRSCQKCGRTFQGRRADAKFCSNACRQAAYRVTARPSSEFSRGPIRNNQACNPAVATEGTANPKEFSVGWRRYTEL